MRLKFTLLLTATLLVFNTLNAQYQRCATTEYQEELRISDPDYDTRMANMERDIQTWIEQNASQKSSSVITIPVVFHILWNTNAQNISDARIMAQLDVMNDDFARLNADAVNTPVVFQPLGVNTQIQFCLAQQDPQGQPTNGIHRVNTTTTSFGMNGNPIKYTSSGGTNAWPAFQYLNIWVGNLGSGLLGYATFPGGNPAIDGVVLLYSSVGGPSSPGTANPYHLGRTATHEIGHWLGLYHINGDSNCGSDQVSDTPGQDQLHFGCPNHPYHANNCTGSANGEMYSNYMDYTDDGCMNIFTNGQSQRMNSVLNTTRSSIQTSPGCLTVGIEEANNISNSVNVYPNPSAGTISISVSKNTLKNASATFVDILGKNLKTLTLEKENTQVDVTDLSNGVYYMKIKTDEGLATKKLILQQ